MYKCVSEEVNDFLLKSCWWEAEWPPSVFAKSAGLPDKTGIFSFCPAETFSLSEKCPVNLSKENNILTTNMPSVLQILICPAKDYSLSDICPASVEKISRRLPHQFFDGPF